MKLSEKQALFSSMIGQLLRFIDSLPGYTVTLGDAYRKGDRKLHGKRLAIDLNLFIEGEYKTDSESHLPLGLFWESLGGSWGGRFENRDGNHYSLAHGRYR